MADCFDCLSSLDLGMFEGCLDVTTVNLTSNKVYPKSHELMDFQRNFQIRVGEKGQARPGDEGPGDIT